MSLNPGQASQQMKEAAEDLKALATKEELKAPIDQFTMAVQKNPSGGGVIKLMWENTLFSVPFTVKK
jgi:hypothetical protein